MTKYTCVYARSKRQSAAIGNILMEKREKGRERNVCDIHIAPHNA